MTGSGDESADLRTKGAYGKGADGWAAPDRAARSMPRGQGDAPRDAERAEEILVVAGNEERAVVACQRRLDRGDRVEVEVVGSSGISSCDVKTSARRKFPTEKSEIPIAIFDLPQTDSCIC